MFNSVCDSLRGQIWKVGDVSQAWYSAEKNEEQSWKLSNNNSIQMKLNWSWTTRLNSKPVLCYSKHFNCHDFLSYVDRLSYSTLCLLAGNLTQYFKELCSRHLCPLPTLAASRASIPEMLMELSHQVCCFSNVPFSCSFGGVMLVGNLLGMASDQCSVS